MYKIRGLNRAIVVSFALVCFGSSGVAIAQMQQWDSQRQLRQEIQLLNLLSGLFLTETQMSFLIDKTRDLEQIRVDFKEKFRRAQASSQTLEQLKAIIKEEKIEVSDNLAQRVHQANKEVLQLKADYEKEVEKAVAQVRRNLTSTQLAILEEFHPCLVPSKGPARFGQANNSTKLVERLEQIRQAPDYHYNLKKYEIADRIAEQLLLYKVKVTQIDEAKLRNKILAIFERVRGLSEIEFNLKKEQLAEELKQDLKNEIVPEHKALDIDFKIEHFLLNPVIISVLEEKLRDSAS